MIKVTRDDDLNIHGRIIKRPTVIFDNDNYAMLKIGEYEEIEEYYKTMRKSLNNIDYSKLNRKLSTMGFPALTKPLERSLELIELPRDQDLIDNVMHNTGYLKLYLGTPGNNVIQVNFEPTVSAFS